MRQPSVREHVVRGALFWSIGLAIAVMVAATFLMVKYRWIAFRVHAAAEAHALVFGLLVLVLLVIGLEQVRRAVSPLQRLRARLVAVRGGTEPRIAGAYPAEVQPLVDELNALIEHHDRAVRRAVAKAGDLAHGLKTPLAVLSQEAGRARRAGHPELASAIDEQVERMRRQMDYHLAHARASASGATPGAAADVRASVEALVRTMQKIYVGRELAFDVQVASVAVRVQPEDLDEMLGNLLDNASKWARRAVRVTSAEDGEGVIITIEDDGPGVAPELREAVLQRGIRADEAAPGSGFGLAIVRDLADVYGGSIHLGAAPGGGLAARLRLPGPNS